VPPTPACYSPTSIEEDGLRAHPPNGVYLLLLGRYQETARCISGLQLARLPLLTMQAMYACPLNRKRIFRGGVQVRGSASHFSRPTLTTPPFANGSMPAP
jgi:hypothetical protein